MWGCHRHRLVVAGLALVPLAWATSAGAQAIPAVDVAWLAPEGCPTASAVQTQIDALLGAAAAARAVEDLAVRAVVEQGTRWLVTIETRRAGSSGHRSLEAATCQGLADATALIVALMIDPAAVAARTEKPPREPPPAASPPPVAAPTPVSVPRSTFGLVGLAGVGHVGVVPAVDVAPALVLGLRRPSWRAELRLAYGLRRVRSEPLAEAGDAYGEFRFHAAALTGCYTLARGPFELGPCAVAEAGVVHGQGIRADRTATQNTPWMALGGGGWLAVKAASWLRFALHVDAMVPLWRPAYVFRIMDVEVFQSPSVGGRLTLSVETSF